MSEKDIAVIVHGTRRLKQRFQLDSVDYSTITEIIRTGNYKHPDVLMHEFVKSYSKRRKKHFLIYKLMPMYLIYDNERHSIVTFY